MSEEPATEQVKRDVSYIIFSTCANNNKRAKLCIIRHFYIVMANQKRRQTLTRFSSFFCFEGLIRYVEYWAAEVTFRPRSNGFLNSLCSQTISVKKNFDLRQDFCSLSTHELAWNKAINPFIFLIKICIQKLHTHELICLKVVF